MHPDTGNTNASSHQLTIDFGEPVAAQPAPKATAQARQHQQGGEAGDNRIYYISFGSGSSGNASYIGNASGGIIIDAGIRAEKIEECLRSNGIPMSRVKGLLLTHDHSDHVRYAYTLLRQNRHLHLFCSNRVLNGVLRRHSISKRIKEYHRPIFKEIPFTIAGMEVTAFDVPHDGTDNMGFSISYAGRNFVIATDLGEVAGRALHYISQSNYLVIESNYDAKMLRDGPYPEYLKARIATDHGHMDNADTARLLARIISPALRNIFLCHLSEDNNTPELALHTTKAALEQTGITVGDCSMSLADRQADVSLMPLPRFDATRLFVFHS